MSKDRLVLTVDGNAQVRKLIGDYLKGANCTVLEAGTAEEAAKAAEQGPKLILLDAAPYALEFLKSLRAGADPNAFKVIVVAREGNPAAFAPFVSLGALDFVLKPFVGAELFGKANKALQMWKGTTPDDLAALNLPWPEGSDASGGGAGNAPAPYVTLPKATPETKAGEPAPEGERQSGDCLVIDDMVNVAKRIRDILPPHIQVESVTTAEEALNLTRTKSFRIVFIDMGLPGTDSGMLLRQINLFQTKANFVGMGLKTSASLMDDARRLGFDAVLNKPLEPQKLTDIVERFFDSSDKIKVEENIVTISGVPMGPADRIQAYLYKVCNDMPGRLELVAEASYSEVIIDALELRGTRKSVIDVLVKLKEAADTLGLGLYLVVTSEVVGYSKEFVETKNLQLFKTVAEAQAAIQSANTGGRA